MPNSTVGGTGPITLNAKKDLAKAFINWLLKQGQQQLPKPLKKPGQSPNPFPDLGDGQSNNAPASGTTNPTVQVPPMWFRDP